MTAAGIEPRFVQGRRYTDERTLEIVANFLAEICGSLVTELHRQGAEAVGSELFGPQLPDRPQAVARQGRQGEPIDLGRVGEVVDVDRGRIEEASARRGDPRHSRRSRSTRRAES